jgi:hypothetical protein
MPVSDTPTTSSPHCASRPPLRIDTPPHSSDFRAHRATRLTVYELLSTPSLAYRKRTTTREAYTIRARLRIFWHWRKENAAQ